MAERLLATRIDRDGTMAVAATDPIADTPMVVTLDELRPYELNPRIARNPKYDDIKASIRARNLDAPPPITRRPGEPFYTIRNGGNTRLAILGELWAETKDDSFFRIKCLFRPWPVRGDIVLLTGHLCESELHGELSFIERSLAVERAREFYEKELGTTLTQTDLAKRLSADGYPITQPHISRMQEAVRYLLPAIPNVLYAGLGKPQVERLTALRKAATRAWDQHAPQASPRVDFPTLFQDVLAEFDAEDRTFDFQRIQDELVWQMSELLNANYDALVLEIVDSAAKQTALSREPRVNTRSHVGPGPQVSVAAPTKGHAPSVSEPPMLEQPKSASSVSRESSASIAREASDPPKHTSADGTPADTRIEDKIQDRLQAHIVTPAETTERLQAIHRTVADAVGEPLSDFRTNVVRAIPVQAGGLHPISDVWYIEPALEAPERLRTHIAQLAREVAQEADLAALVESIDEGIGFSCADPGFSSSHPPPPAVSRAVLVLLAALSGVYLPPSRSNASSVRLSDYLAPLLQGSLPILDRPALKNPDRVSDAGLVKLFRMIRLARRLVELQSAHNPITGSIDE